MKPLKLALTSTLALSLVLSGTAAFANSAPAVKTKAQPIPMVKLFTAGAPSGMIETKGNVQKSLQTISGKVLEVSEKAVRFEDSSKMTYSLPLELFTNSKDVQALGLKKGDAISVKNEMPLMVSAVMIRLPEGEAKVIGGAAEDVTISSGPIALSTEKITLSTEALQAVPATAVSPVAFTITAANSDMKLADLPLPFATAIEAGGKTIVLKRVN